MPNQSLEHCSRTGVTIPECSCLACARGLIERYAGGPPGTGEASSADGRLESLRRGIVDPSRGRQKAGEAASIAIAIRRAFPRHFAARA